MVGTLTADFVRTARAKGLGRGAVIFRYGLRNSLIVVTTVIGLQLGGLIAGAVVTERIFTLPGIGKLTLDSLLSRDYPVIQAVVLVVTASYIVINLLVDLLYTVIDPRIRVSGRAQ
jgi:peptide/nickel transport system permease protein